ncbi:MAG: hypothetical protein P1V20_08410 [Verrucomicrobiales bacterium]|nr:hypothetical protein [Verrucomicrobiales bacterium]
MAALLVGWLLTNIRTPRALPSKKNTSQLPITLALVDHVGTFGFEWIQGSVYTCNDESMTNLFSAVQALKSLPWFSASVRDFRAFRVENWSDFTPLIKGGGDD